MCANNRTRLMHEFNPRQKIVLRLLFVSFIAVGAYAVFLHSTAWGWIYLGVTILGQAVFVLPGLCGHCPYPHQFNDCLFLPAGIMRRLVKYRGPKITHSETAQIGITLLLVVGIPQVWLIRETWLLILFWALLVPYLCYFPFYLCRHCRHAGCPANRTGQTLGPDQIQSYRRL